MATYNLRRFANAASLKAIAPQHLLEFLEPYRPYLENRDLTLPTSPAPDGLDYERLVSVLMSPGTDTPKKLIDALYFVHEMSIEESMDVLLDEAKRKGLQLNGQLDPTAADVAVQVYLRDKALLERKHAERYLTRPRSFEHFQTDVQPLPAYEPLSLQTRAALERALDDWFVQKKRGRGSRIFEFLREDEIWFLVRHGDPFRREGSFDAGQISSVFYRPEKHDVLVYDRAIGEIRMHACNKGEKEIYRKEFGRHVFGNEDFFPGTSKYTLEPLRRDGPASVICTDVDGMEWARLKEIQFLWRGAEQEIEIRKASDLFAAFNARGRGVPVSASILRASFLVQFTDSKTPRTVTIRPSNIAQYTRDSDAGVVEDWLQKRGFIEQGEGEE